VSYFLDSQLLSSTFTWFEPRKIYRSFYILGSPKENERTITMAKFNLWFLPGLIAWFLCLTSVASSHVLEKRLGNPLAASKVTKIPLHERSDFYDNEVNSTSAFVKRTVFNFDSNKPEDVRILQQAFTDMVEIVTYVQQNPNPQVLARYFSPNDQADVTAIFNTVRQLAQPGGHPDPETQFGPKDLSQIVIHRGGTAGGLGTTLAQSFDTSPSTTHPRIDLYDFGWGALYKRLRSELNCDCDIKKTNYKMYILGSVLLHETLYIPPTFTHLAPHVQNA